MQHAAKQVGLHVLLPATVITPSCVSRQQPRRPIEARVARKRIRHIRCTIRNPEPRRFKNKSGRRTADRPRHRRRIKRRRRLDIANQSARHIDRTRTYSLIRTMPAFDPIGSPQVSIIAQNICFLLAPTGRPPWSGPHLMLVHDRVLGQRLSARRCWSGLRSRALSKQNRRRWWTISQCRMRADLVVEQGLRTPTRPFAGRFYIGFIRGLGARSSSTRQLIRRMAPYSSVRWPARMSRGGSRSPYGCLIELHARPTYAFLPSPSLVCKRSARYPRCWIRR